MNDAEQQDSSHFAANGDEAKSLQPLLDAEERKRFEVHFHFDYSTKRDAWGHLVYAQEHVESIWYGWKTRAALGNRTPARQEERSSKKEVGAAPLPAQGLEAKRERDAILAMLDEFIPETGEAWPAVNDIRALIAKRGEA